MNETAELGAVAIGATIFIAVVLATRRSWCEEPAPPEAPDRAEPEGRPGGAGASGGRGGAAARASRERGAGRRSPWCARSAWRRSGTARRAASCPGAGTCSTATASAAWARSKGSCPLCSAGRGSRRDPAAPSPRTWCSKSYAVAYSPVTGPDSCFGLCLMHVEKPSLVDITPIWMAMFYRSCGIAHSTLIANVMFGLFIYMKLAPFCFFTKLFHNVIFYNVLCIIFMCRRWRGMRV